MPPGRVGHFPFLPFLDFFFRFLFSFFGRLSSLTITTGISASRTTFSAHDPSRMRTSPVLPRLPITISILDKEYTVSCPPGEEDSLRESARVLGERMSNARDAGKTLGTERVAVVTALNVIHEYLSMDRQHREQAAEAERDLSRIEDKIAATLGRRSEGDGVN